MNELVAVWKKLVKNRSVIVFFFALWRIVGKSLFNCFKFLVRNQIFTDVLLQSRYPGHANTFKYFLSCNVLPF